MGREIMGELVALEVLETANRMVAVREGKGEKKSARWPESEWVEN